MLDNVFFKLYPIKPFRDHFLVQRPKIYKGKHISYPKQKNSKSFLQCNRPPTRRGKDTRYSLNRRLVGRQNRSGQFAEEKKLLPLSR
jgi:hypothetical protein